MKSSEGIRFDITGETHRAKGGRVITQFANRFSVLINKFLLARDIMEC